MSTHTRAQLGRVIRLTLLVLVALISTAPIHDVVARYPAAAAVVGVLEAAYRQLRPTVPLSKWYDLANDPPATQPVTFVVPSTPPKPPAAGSP